jgi:hypothetical protein
VRVTRYDHLRRRTVLELLVPLLDVGILRLHVREAILEVNIGVLHVLPVLTLERGAVVQV